MAHTDFVVVKKATERKGEESHDNEILHDREEGRRAYIVSEGDCPNARATGEYDSLREAQDAVLAVSGRVDLDWDYGEDEGVD